MGPGLFEQLKGLPLCGDCSSDRIDDLNTSKAKLRGAKYQREKTKIKLFF